MATALAEVPSPTRSRAKAALASWEVDRKELDIKERVGVGATAHVHRAIWHGTDVAVKRMFLPLLEVGGASKKASGPPDWFRRELELMLELRHPNLVLFMGASMPQDDTPPLIVSEFCEGGTLFQLLHERPTLHITWPQRMKIARDTAKGMNFLHCRRVIHRDLKSLNLLLVSKVATSDDTCWVKVSDFGLSRRLPVVAPALEVMTGGLGTYLWMAPEVLLGGSYDLPADVYSFAIVLFEVICRRLPFEGAVGATAVAAAVAMSKGERPDVRQVPITCPNGLARLMERCWLQAPAARPSFGTILELLATLSEANKAAHTPRL